MRRLIAQPNTSNVLPNIYLKGAHEAFTLGVVGRRVLALFPWLGRWFFVSLLIIPDIVAAELLITWIKTGPRIRRNCERDCGVDQYSFYLLGKENKRLSEDKRNSRLDSSNGSYKTRGIHDARTRSPTNENMLQHTVLKVLLLPV